MDLGVMIFPTDQTIQPTKLGVEAEARGFESIWFPEHSHIPVSRVTPWGGRKGAPPLPEFYARTHEQFVALGAVAAVTKTIKLGTGITLLAQRDPVWTAKAAASVDHISGGRFILGVGYGWNKEELNTHGVAYADRRDRLRECVLAIKELWSAEVASFEGEYINIEPSWAWPKPVTDPHPPIILGGSAGPKTAAHIAEFCDGWMPISAGSIESGWANITKACEEIGRDITTVQLGLFRASPYADKLKEFEQMGVSRALFNLPQAPEDEVMQALDEFAEFL